MMVVSPVTNVAELLRRRSGALGDKVAVIDGARHVSWAELDAMADAVSGGLSSLGLVGGHRVGLAMVNAVEFVASYLGVLRGGLVAVPINPTSTTGEVARVLANSGARVCIADATTIATLRSAIGGVADFFESPRDGVPSQAAVVPRIVVTGAPPAAGETAYDALTASGTAVLSPRDPESLAVLLYTSGTSGRPRAAMLSHRALLANIEQAGSTNPAPMAPEDTVLGVLPLFHVYGLNAVLGQVLAQGATIVLGRRFDPDETLRLVEAERVTCVPVAPPVVVEWSHRDDIADRLASVRTLLSGAAPLAEGLGRDFEARTGITIEQGYGLTEASPIVTSTVGSPVHKPGSTGRALPGVELRVVDGSGNAVDADDPGEILIRGANLFSGYWPTGDEGPDADGWLATGDIGFLDADGDLFLVDRLKELVIVSGFNVYPSEIEEVVSEVDGVSECAVIGIPDEKSGEAVVAYVVAADGVDPAELAAKVRDHCEQRVARFKVPSAIEVVTQLPHSATGKVAKGRLRASEARRAMGLL